MKTLFSSLSGMLGLRRNLFFWVCGSFWKGRRHLRIERLGDMLIHTWHWGCGSRGTLARNFYAIFLFSMLIQSFFGFDPFAVESHGSYGSELWVDVLLWARLLFPFVVWGGAVKLLSSFFQEKCQAVTALGEPFVFSHFCASVLYPSPWH